MLAAAGAVAPGCAGGGEGSGDTGEQADEAQSTQAYSGDDDNDDDDNLESPDVRLKETLDRLASYGEKRAGTWQNRQAGDYIKERFEDAGLSDVHCEEFSMNFYDVISSSLTLTAGAAGETPVALPIAGHKVFAYSGKGSFQNFEVVDVGEGRVADYVAPVQGKIVLVRASQTFHRRNQLRIALEQGAVAMISTSFSPSNLIQVGTVSPPELGFGPAPTVSIGGTDGANIRAQLAAGKTVRASLQVDAKVEVRKARNIVGRKKRSGSQWNDPYILVGAHYDTWSTGSTDNGTGVAALLEMADTVDKSTLQHDIVFVAYDAEEVGLLGGYDYLRRHVVVGNEAIKAFMNLEMIGRAKPELGGATLQRFFVHTQGGPMARLAEEADIDTVYPVIAGLENVAPTSGGNIPTDAQGFYWYGIDGTIGFGASPFYHTSADTPDTIDMPFLVSNTNALKNFLGRLDDEPSASLAPRDPTLYYPEVTTDSSNPGFLRVRVTVRDANSVPVANPWARVQLYVSDFITPQQAGVPENLSAVQELVGDAEGKVTFDIASSLVQSGWSSRWVQVRVGNANERFARGEGLKKL